MQHVACEVVEKLGQIFETIEEGSVHLTITKRKSGVLTIAAGNARERRQLTLPQQLDACSVLDVVNTIKYCVEEVANAKELARNYRRE